MQSSLIPRLVYASLSSNIPRFEVFLKTVLKHFLSVTILLFLSVTPCVLLWLHAMVVLILLASESNEAELLDFRGQESRAGKGIARMCISFFLQFKF